MPERRGRSLEELTQTLFKVEAASGGQVTFEKLDSPGFVIDKDTGVRREFDVLASGKIGRMPYTLAIECKDWAAPVDTPVVEGFISKCNGTNIPLRMIVSASGFTAGALAKGAAHGIQCRTLAEVGSLPWLGLGFMTNRARTITGTTFFCQVAEEWPVGEEKVILDADGKRIDEATMRSLALFAARQLPVEDFDDGPHSAKVLVSDTGWRAVRQSGRELPVLTVEVTVNFETETTSVPVATYLQDLHNEKPATGVAVADFPLGKLIFSENPDGTKSVHFVPKAAAS